MISATGLLSIIFFGSLLVYLVWRFLQKDEWLVYTGSRVIIWFLMIAMIRMVIPFELGFETSIYLGWGLPALRDFLITPLVFGEIAVSRGIPGSDSRHNLANRCGYLLFAVDVSFFAA